MTSFWCKFSLDKFFGASSQSNHWAGHCWWFYKIHFLLHVTIQSRSDLLFLSRIREYVTLKQWFFFLFRWAHEAPSHWGFHLSSLLQMLNDCRMVDVELFGNFSCSFKRVSFDDCSQLVVNFQWPTIALLIFKAFVSFAKPLESSLHCTFISSSWAKCVVDVLSCLHWLMIHF